MVAVKSNHEVRIEVRSLLRWVRRDAISNGMEEAKGFIAKTPNPVWKRFSAVMNRLIDNDGLFDAPDPNYRLLDALRDIATIMLTASPALALAVPVEIFIASRAGAKGISTGWKVVKDEHMNAAVIYEHNGMRFLSAYHNVMSANPNSALAALFGETNIRVGN